jgi:hypothetical protein
METKKNYRKPDYDEIVMNAKAALLAGSDPMGDTGSW